MALKLTSAAFGANETIPDRYTCGGTNVSPPLSWHGTPAEAKSLVLLCDDPDSSRQPWSHWVLYDIPPTVDELEEDIPSDSRLSSGALQGRNDFGDIGYGGPCPSSGTHHYYFRLYALDSEIEIPPGANRAQVLDLIRDHVVAESDLMGRYTRS
jgi:Raf kinase inhibitor-like YbhB/YbcL family protein